MEKQYYTRQEAAELLNISVWKLDRVLRENAHLKKLKRGETQMKYSKELIEKIKLKLNGYEK
ncbi:MAG: hypothetical protein KDC72_09455 [Bacteroidetes bacterium]|nr:hypothetical protein [Bacteroidota bacterium]